MGKALYLDRFSAGLDELSRKEQRSEAAVIEVLRRTKRFSCFEASENAVIASTMTRLCKTRLTTEHVGYPWTKVTEIDGKPL